MRVVCDNCGATYKIPEAKLVKEVNKATCRKCGHRMLIRKAQDQAAASASPQAGHEAFRSAAQAAASAASAAPRSAPARPAPRAEWEEEDPTHIAQLDAQGHPIAPERSAPQAPPPVPTPAAPVAAPAPAAPQVPRPAAAVPAAPAPAAPAPAAPAPAAAAPIRPAAPAPAVAPAPVAARPAFDPSGDMALVGFGMVVALIGALVLAVNVDGGVLQRFVGLLMGLWGTLTALFVLVTGSRGRKKASKVLSIFLGSFFAFGGAAVIGLVTLDADAVAEGAFAGLLTPDAEEDPAVAATPATARPVDERIDALFAEDPAEPAVADATEDNTAAADPLEADPATPPAQTPPPAATEPARAASTTSSAPSSSSSGSSSSSDRSSSSSSSARTSGSSTSSSSDRSSGSSASSDRSSSSGSTSSGSTSSGSTSSGSSTAAAAPTTSSSSSSSGSAQMTTLPATVVDTMMKSNKNIKKCFYQEYKRSEGNLGTATIRFKVLPSGKVSSAYVTTSRYKGTELDSCLSSATYTVAFPAFNGETVTLEWTGGAG